MTILNTSPPINFPACRWPSPPPGEFNYVYTEVAFFFLQRLSILDSQFPKRVVLIKDHFTVTYRVRMLINPNKITMSNITDLTTTCYITILCYIEFTSKLNINNVDHKSVEL